MQSQAPLAGVTTSIGPGLCALAVTHIILPLAKVVATGLGGLCAIPMARVVLPLACVLLVASGYTGTLSMAVTIVPLADIGDPAGPAASTLTMPSTFAPLSGIAHPLVLRPYAHTKTVGPTGNDMAGYPFLGALQLVHIAPLSRLRSLHRLGDQGFDGLTGWRGAGGGSGRIAADVQIAADAGAIGGFERISFDITVDLGCSTEPHALRGMQNTFDCARHGHVARLNMGFADSALGYVQFTLGLYLTFELTLDAHRFIK